MGTPYHPCAGIKGVGVDCAIYPLKVYSALGLIEDVDVGSYPPDWYLHQDGERYLEWVLRLGAREVESPERGDFALFRFGRTYSHGAIVDTWPIVYHSVVRLGVYRDDASTGKLAERPTLFFTLPERG